MNIWFWEVFMFSLWETLKYIFQTLFSKCCYLKNLIFCQFFEDSAHGFETVNCKPQDAVLSACWTVIAAAFNYSVFPNISYLDHMYTSTTARLRHTMMICLKELSKTFCWIYRCKTTLTLLLTAFNVVIFFSESPSITRVLPVLFSPALNSSLWALRTFTAVEVIVHLLLYM